MIEREWDKLINTLEMDPGSDDYADDWWCQECEYGPMIEADNKCKRCGHPWNGKHTDEEYDEDGELKEKYEEIF